MKKAHQWDEEKAWYALATTPTNNFMPTTLKNYVLNGALDYSFQIMNKVFQATRDVSRNFLN